jgi:deoxyribodipyrimidine photo-lyase
MQAINVVWLKKDLRVTDHVPLYQAMQQNIPCLIVYLYEPTLLQHPDTSDRHIQFIYQSLQVMQQALHTLQHSLNILYVDAIPFFTYLNKHYCIKHIFSHQESGCQHTYNRDKAVNNFCLQNNITWVQHQQHGVIRGISNREQWDALWYSYMCTPIQAINWQQTTSLSLASQLFSLPADFETMAMAYSKLYQPAGYNYAWQYFKSFLLQRGSQYSKGISKPALSRITCSRLSPYITWGCISVRQVYQTTVQHVKQHTAKAAFTNFATRLKWHCHFIQKFEVECRYETQCINKGYELLKHPPNSNYIKAWQTGTTGYPLVDANMRCVAATGWINFRMRALVVSFLTHHLFQDWRTGVYHLAQMFLDYEPGIHYPQFQMQAGTTGINTIRIYNPVKNSLAHDADAEFIKKWCPELAHLPLAYIHEPYLMTELEQLSHNCILGQHYPKPIIDLQSSRKQAADAIWQHRKTDLVQQENFRILYTHTRRKSVNESDNN